MTKIELARATAARSRPRLSRLSRHRPCKIFALLCVALVAVTSAGYSLAGAAPRDTGHEQSLAKRMAQDDTAIRTASAGWSNAAQSKDLEQALTFFADDAILLSPKSPAVLGKENIRQLWRQMLAIPGPGLSFSPERIEVARSGDLAWEYGNYEFGASDENGKTTTEKGTYVTVWKKQPQGAWKVIGDFHNTNE